MHDADSVLQIQAISLKFDMQCRILSGSKAS